MIDNTKNYNKSEELKPKEWFWLPTGKVGSKECHWVHYTNVPIFKQIMANQKYLFGILNSLGVLTKNKLDSLDKRGTKSVGNNLYKMYDGSEIIFEDEDAYTFEMTGDFISKFIQIDIKKIFRGELDEETQMYLDANCLKWVDGKLEKDIEKFEYQKTIGV